MEALRNEEGVPDYSSIHTPIGDLLLPQDKVQWTRYKLSQDQVDQFWRDGFLLNIPMLTPEQCDRILEEDYSYFMGNKSHPGMEMMYEYHTNQTGDPSQVLMHGLGQWRLTKNFHDLVFMPQAVVPASQLADPNKEMTTVRFWFDQMFAKPAKHGGNVAWHQDYSYWTITKPLRHVIVHIALEDQTEENGGLQYVPGSHRWSRNGGEPLPVTDFTFKDMDSIKTVLTDEEIEQFKPVFGHLKKGEASIHHGLTVHGSYSNKSDKPRRTAIVNYFQDGVYSDTDDKIFKGTKGVRVPKGEKMAGQFFPIVFDPKWIE